MFAPAAAHPSTKAPLSDDRTGVDLLLWANTAGNAPTIPESDAEGSAAGPGNLADVPRLLLLLLATRALAALIAALPLCACLHPLTAARQ